MNNILNTEQDETTTASVLSTHANICPLTLTDLGDHWGAEFEINAEILVTTGVYAYDVFALVVDLGSALGLWLSLSALIIFDYILLSSIKIMCKDFIWK